MLTPEEFNKLTARLALQKLQAPEEGNISKAFRGGIEQAKSGYEQARYAKNPIELLKGGIKLGAGAVNTIFSPLAPITEPIGKGVEYVSEKISDIPAVQKFAQTKAGQFVESGAEDIANLSTITGAVAGLKGIKPAVNVVKPVVGATGRALKETGKSAYGVTITASEGVNRAVSAYKESTPNLMTRIKNTLAGKTKGKPITETESAARFGLIGTEKEIGVQAGRYMKKVWTEKVQPALSQTKGKLEMNKFWSALEKKIRAENPELIRRNALLEGLNDLKSGYGKVSRVGLEKLQTYKEGWTKFQSENVWKGKPISSATKEVMMLAGDIARDFIYKNTPEGTRQAYIDYGNLKSIREAGIKSGVGDPAKKSISRGAWQFVMDKAVTPVATTMGKILYRTGEGLEFIGEAGAKTVGDIIGKTGKTNPGKLGFTSRNDVLGNIKNNIKMVTEDGGVYGDIKTIQKSSSYPAILARVKTDAIQTLKYAGISIPPDLANMTVTLGNVQSIINIVEKALRDIK